MPRLLAQRAEAAYDCIATFRDAARMRFQEAELLWNDGRGTAAVYLSGYTIELTVKIAVLRVNGFSPRQPVTLGDLHQLVAFGRTRYGLARPRNLHDFTFWSLLLVQHRLTLGRSYRNPRAGQEIVRRSQESYSRWREILRYRTNVAYRHEVTRVMENARWFLGELNTL
jgi:hypothetical protein